MLKRTGSPIRYAVTIEYDGQPFCGFQYQPKQMSVQQALEEAIFKRFHEHARVLAASRTDAGVHAKGQVAVFDLNKRLQPARLSAALNTSLPPAIRVLYSKVAPAGWQPRHEARYKVYTYLIYNRAIHSPFWQGRAYHYPRPLEIAAMKKGAAYLLGRHDFSSLQASGCSAKDPVRELQGLTIRRQGDLIVFKFQGTAFLYHMVRNIIGTLINVGNGQWPARQVLSVLQARDRRQAGPTAPACGLYLEKIVFGRKKPSRNYRKSEQVSII